MYEVSIISWTPGLRYTEDERKKLDYCGVQLGSSDNSSYTTATISNKNLLNWLAAQSDATSITIHTLDEKFREVLSSYKSPITPRTKTEAKEDYEFEL